MTNSELSSRMDYSGEMEEFYNWRSLVGNDKLTLPSRKKEVRNCKDLLTRLRHHPEHIENYLKDYRDEAKNKSTESKDYRLGEWKIFSFSTLILFISKSFKAAVECRGRFEGSHFIY